MVRYKFKSPNLLEIAIIFSIILVVAFGWLGISVTGKSIEAGNLASAVSSWSLLQTIFLWLILITMLLNAAILEGIREKL